MSLVLYTVSNRVATLTLNRPEKRNALNYDLVTGLIAALQQVENDPDVKVVVITGAGSSFCAGADLESLQKLQANTHKENLEDSAHLARLFQTIYQLEKVVVAKVNGHALAGGCGLAGVCDFAFSTPEAKFGYTEVRIGFVPAIVMTFLVRKIGEGKARELLLTGKVLTAAEAQAYGLINQTVNTDLDTFVDSFAQDLCNNNSEASMGMTKRMLDHLHYLSLDEALPYAAEMNALARETEDCKKGIGAFLDKKDIKW